MNIASRGKWAESEFKKWADKKSSACKDFAWLRYPDARAGSKVAAPSDFGAVYRGKPYVIEIKEVEHTHLLPKKNFAIEKINRMRKWMWAGSSALVIVYFKDAAVWRTAPLDWFFEHYKEKGAWDMREFPARTLIQILEVIEQ